MVIGEKPVRAVFAQFSEIFFSSKSSVWNGYRGAKHHEFLSI
jgi:hypothetical protein